MVAFNNIPTTLRVPFFFTEIDNSNASQGPAVKFYKMLVVGQKLAAGTQAELTKVTITSEPQARTLFGVGSQLWAMLDKVLKNNQNVVEIQAMAIDDAGAAVDATGKITIAAGTATADGILYVMIGGRAIQVAVASGDDQDAVCAALVAAITADSELAVTAAVNGSNANECDLTAKNGGEAGNEIRTYFNYNSGEEFPAGISASGGDLSSGAGNPDISEIIAALPEEQFDIIACPWKDTANLAALKAELDSRWGPTRAIDGRALACQVDSLGNLQTLGNSKNSEHLSIINGGGARMPEPDYEIAAAYSAQAAVALQTDPARPLQTLVLVDIKPPLAEDEFTLQERNILLTDGIATARVGAGGVVQIERAITTFQTNAAGGPDVSYLDITTLHNLSYLRYDWNATLNARFPRSKLADDGVRIGPGQSVMTPSLGKGLALEKFRDWELLGLVENFDQFKRDLVVERNAQDVNRMDWLLPPDLINQLIVGASQFQFLL